jgi:hypothetical protein
VLAQLAGGGIGVTHESNLPSSGQPATESRPDAPAIDELPARSSPPARDSKRPLLLHWATEASIGDAYKPLRQVVAVAEVGPGPNWPKLGDWRGFACKRHWISIPVHFREGWVCQSDGTGQWPYVWCGQCVRMLPASAERAPQDWAAQSLVRPASQADDAPNAYDILNSICFDILNVQIGTSMFWKTDEELREDHFAEYVHYWLLKASKDLGWEHDDSSAVWK